MKIKRFIILSILIFFAFSSVRGIEFTNEMIFNISLSKESQDITFFRVINKIYPDKPLDLDTYVFEPTMPRGAIIPGSLNISYNKGNFELELDYIPIAGLHVDYTDNESNKQSVDIPSLSRVPDKDSLRIKKVNPEKIRIGKTDPLNISFSMLLSGYLRKYPVNTFGVEYDFLVPEANFDPPAEYKNILFGRVEIPFTFLNSSAKKELYIPYIIDCSRGTTSLDFSFEEENENSIILLETLEHTKDFYLNFLFTIRDKPPITVEITDTLDTTKENRILSEIRLCNKNFGDAVNYEYVRDLETNELKGIKFLRKGGEIHLERGSCRPVEPIYFEKYLREGFDVYPLENYVYSGKRDFISLITWEEGFGADFELIHNFKLVIPEQFGLEKANIDYTYNKIGSISEMNIPEYQKKLVDQCEGHIQMTYNIPSLDESSFESPPLSFGGTYEYKEKQKFVVYGPFKEGYLNYSFHVKRSFIERYSPFFILILFFILGHIYFFKPQIVYSKIPILEGRNKLFYFTSLYTLVQFLYQFLLAEIRDFVKPNSITLWLTIIFYIYFLMIFLIKRK